MAKATKADAVKGTDAYQDICDRALGLIKRDVALMKEPLDGAEANRLTGYIRVLVPMAKDMRERTGATQKDMHAATVDELVKLWLEKRDKPEP